MELPSTAQPNFYDFLNRMRHPAAADLIRSIKRSSRFSFAFCFFAKFIDPLGVQSAVGDLVCR